MVLFSAIQTTAEFTPSIIKALSVYPYWCTHARSTCMLHEMKFDTHQRVKVWYF